MYIYRFFEDHGENDRKKSIHVFLGLDGKQFCPLLCLPIFPVWMGAQYFFHFISCFKYNITFHGYERDACLQIVKVGSRNLQHPFTVLQPRRFVITAKRMLSCTRLQNSSPVIMCHVCTTGVWWVSLCDPLTYYTAGPIGK